MACRQRADQGQAETSPWQQNTFPNCSTPGPRRVLSLSRGGEESFRFACQVDAMWMPGGCQGHPLEGQG